VRVPAEKMVDMRTRLARVMAIAPLRAVTWRASNRTFLGTFIGALAAIYLFVLLVDPYGVAPFSLPFDRPLTSTQRQIFPQILRSGRYDSVVIGTSTSMLLDPAVLDRVLGGHFATFAQTAATAAEQVQALDYFRRTVPAPNTVIIGLDHEWCFRNGNDGQRETTAAKERDFPFWAYDGSRWNDLFYLLNTPTVDAAGRAVGGLLGWTREKLRKDGYEITQRPDSTYDAAAARGAIWSPVPHWSLPGSSEADRAAVSSFEALPWLDESLARLPARVKKYLLLPPVHIHALPEPGSLREAWEAECKRRIATIARRRGALLVDWRIASPTALEDTDFWDPIHYRAPIADRLIDDLGHIVNEGRESPDGSYRILVR
jgi:hypothetical protein